MCKFASTFTSMGTTGIKYDVTAVMVTLIWGGTFINTRLLIDNGVAAHEIYFLRAGIAYTALWLFCMASGRGMRVRSKTLRDEATFLLLGVTGGSLYFMTENAAIGMTVVNNVSFIVSSCPFFATLIAILFTKSLKANKNIMAGGLTAIAGLALVVFNGKFILKLSPTGDMLAMAACLSWAVYSVVMRSVTERYDAVMVTRKIFGYGLMTGAPILLAKGWDCGWETLSKPVVAGNVVFLGLGPSFLCFLIWTKVIKEIGTVRATNYLYLNPVSTMVVSAIVLGEVVTPLAFIGAGLILAGIYISMKKPKENA